MLIQCAWCNRDLGEKEPLKDKSTTHTICQECSDKYFTGKSFKNPERAVMDAAIKKE